MKGRESKGRNKKLVENTATFQEGGNVARLASLSLAGHQRSVEGYWLDSHS